ncbi:undecaprenyl-phosphate glucose phosphotransferase [bacterium]|nr:undecaprenyl-phosphate glucose phosphotransferase [bacterium]
MTIARRRTFVLSLAAVADIAIVVAAWLAAYPIRFDLGVIPLFVDHVPRFSEYAWLGLLVAFIWTLVFFGSRLHAQKTIPSLFREVYRALRAHAIAFSLFVVATFFLAQYKPSRVVYAIFALISTIGIAANRAAFRQALLARRRRGIGVRRVLVVGAGDLGREVAARLARHRELGLLPIGFLSDESPGAPSIDGLPVFGAPTDVERVIAAQNVETVFVALPLSASDRLRAVLDCLGEEMVDVKVVPDLYQYVTLRAGVEEFDGLPVISLKESPLYGWKALQKRAFDLVASALGLIVLSPLFALVAILVKLTSPGPIFYRQERMGLDGRVFDILKFRSMRQDAEAQTGAVWAKEGDPRRTRFGAFLRKTNIDELPQLLNVLRGEMSLVGPRPERPVFIEQFRREIPKYMLRHRVKAGITGWAQANGWRGDTDLRRRIECDIYYIENWSFALDLRIIWMTLVRGFFDKNAY